MSQSSRRAVPGDRAISVAQVFLVALPLLTVIAMMWNRPWFPSSDWATTLLRVSDVGGPHTPLVGAYGRYGWSHPGPLLFYVLAPFFRAFGNSGLLVGSAAINLVAVVGAVVAARRRGGALLGGLTAVVALLLCAGMTTMLLINPWNPWVPVLPFFALILLAWGIADGDAICLPWAALVASFVVQCHIGYALIAATTLVAAIVLTMVRRTRSGIRRPFVPRRWGPILATAAIGAICWLPAIIQEFTGRPGNISAIIDFLLHSSKATAGWSKAAGIMSRALGWSAPWITGNEGKLHPFPAPGPLAPGIAVVIAVVALGAVAWRLGHASAGRLAVIAMALVVAGTVSIAQITEAPVSYLMRWSWVIAAAAWLSILVSLTLCTRTLIARRSIPAPSFSLSRVMNIALLAVAAIISASLLPSAIATPVPEAPQSTTIGKLAELIQPSLNRHDTYQLVWFDSSLFQRNDIGLMAELRQRGYHVVLTPSDAHQVGAFRVRSRDRVDAVISGVSGDLVTKGWTPPAGTKVIARYNRATPADQRETASLRKQIDEVNRALSAIPEAEQTPKNPRFNKLEADLYRLNSQFHTPERESANYVVALGTTAGH